MVPVFDVLAEPHRREILDVLGPGECVAQADQELLGYLRYTGCKVAVLRGYTAARYG